MEQQTAITTTTALSLQNSQDSLDAVQLALGETSGQSVVSISTVTPTLKASVGVGNIITDSTIKSFNEESIAISASEKIVSKNLNGTVIKTSGPTNEAELQLYRVLQKASLLTYYDTLLEMGGDDVQQLCDAGEDEFLEIMALVGMASKPLHVRRLQKSLHEWMINPSEFRKPLSKVDILRSSYSPESSVISYRTNETSYVGAQNYVSSPSSSNIPITSSLTNLATNLHQISTSALQLTPSLTESQVSRITDAAERLSCTVPHLEPKPHNAKKKSTREMDLIIAMSELDPKRMEEIRKYSAIYGRFDCKRKPEKPLTLHEVCVNEAAAQICKFIPTLLTRRDELFPLARQVVKDAGFGHPSSIRLSTMRQAQNRSFDEIDVNQSKRSRLCSESVSELGKELSPLSCYQFDRAFELSDRYNIRYAKSDVDDGDSRFTFSNSSSSPMQQGSTTNADSVLNNITIDSIKDEHQHTQNEASCLGIHIISSSGGNIIAVANPALGLSSTSLSIKREVMSPNHLA